MYILKYEKWMIEIFNGKKIATIFTVGNIAKF